MKPTRLIFMRHGETPWTREHRYQGSSDTALTARGRTQVASAVPRIRREAVHFIFSSELTRAKQSAAIIGKSLHKRTRSDERINELSFGKWEGRTARELLRSGDKAFQQWCRGRFVTPSGGESLGRFRKRTGAFLDFCRKRYAGKNLLVVTHGGTIRMMLCRLLGLGLKDFWIFQAAPGSLTRVDLYGKRAVLEYHNYTA